jgi:hypothetical protein
MSSLSGVGCADSCRGWARPQECLFGSGGICGFRGRKATTKRWKVIWAAGLESASRLSGRACSPDVWVTRHAILLRAGASQQRPAGRRILQDSRLPAFCEDHIDAATVWSRHAALRVDSREIAAATSRSLQAVCMFSVGTWHNSRGDEAPSAVRGCPAAN